VLEVNKRAIDSGIRGIHDENIGGVLDMNRFFQDDPIKKDGYEYFRSRELMPLLQSSDYMLDLHSTS
jgi:succinylglutamate desuccinylase